MAGFSRFFSGLVRQNRRETGFSACYIAVFRFSGDDDYPGFCNVLACFCPKPVTHRFRGEMPVFPSYIMLRMLSLHPDRRCWPAPARGIQRQTSAPGGRGPAGRRANGGRMARQVKGRGSNDEERPKFGDISGVESILKARASNRASVA